MFKKKAKQWKFTYHGPGGVRAITVPAKNETTAKQIAETRLNKQFGMQKEKRYLALRDPEGKVILDENGEPVISDEYEIIEQEPRNLNGEPDSTLLQSNYNLVKTEKFNG